MLSIFNYKKYRDVRSASNRISQLENINFSIHLEVCPRSLQAIYDLPTADVQLQDSNMLLSF